MTMVLRMIDNYNREPNNYDDDYDHNLTYNYVNIFRAVKRGPKIPSLGEEVLYLSQ